MSAPAMRNRPVVQPTRTAQERTPCLVESYHIVSQRTYAPPPRVVQAVAGLWLALELIGMSALLLGLMAALYWALWLLAG